MGTEMICRRQLRNTNTGDATEQLIHRGHLPEKIISQILSKLPVKSLLRFKCVSKSWRSLISSKQFIETHLENSKKNEFFAHHRIISKNETFAHHNKIISRSWKSLGDFSLHSLLTEKSATRAVSYEVMKDNQRDLFIIGCCNGLICVLDRKRFLLWNPSTKECKELPELCPDLTKIGGYISRGGFGFDERSGDYKVFAVFQLFKWPIRSMGRVYSLKADSWIGDGVFKNASPLDTVCDKAGKFVNGKFHWRRDLLHCGRRDFKPKSNWEIVTYDLKSETVGIVKPPNCLKDSPTPGLAVLNGCLCVNFDYPKRSNNTGFDIWIWKEYGVEDSWSKLLTVSYLSEYCMKPPLLASYNSVTPLFVSPKGEVLFIYESSLYIYNPKDDWVRPLHVFDIREIVDIYDAEVYTESLVSLKPDDHNDQQGRQALEQPYTEAARSGQD